MIVSDDCRRPVRWVRLVRMVWMVWMVLPDSIQHTGHTSHRQVADNLLWCPKGQQHFVECIEITLCRLLVLSRMALPVSHVVKSQCVIETKRMKQTRAADLRNRYRKRLWSWHGLRLPACFCICRFRRFHRPVRHKQNLSRSRIDTERMRAGRKEKKHAEHEEKKETHVEQMPPSDRRKYSWFAG